VNDSAEIEDRRGERTVRLRTSGFESCTVRAPSWDVHESLDWYFRHPARVSASTFVTEVITASLVPARPAHDVARLAERERARLRVAVIAACGREREWRRLRGSHLAPDERLMAVLVWRWRESERLIARLRERRRELDAAVETVSGTVVGIQSVGDRALKSMSMLSKVLNPFPNYSKLLRPFPDYAKLLKPFPDYAKLTPRFPDVSTLGYHFPDPAHEMAARTVRSLYSDPSPLVLARAGGADSFVWSKQLRSVLGLGEPAWMKTVRKMSDDLLGTKTMQVALGNFNLMHGAVPAGPPGITGPSLSALALLRLPTFPLTGIDDFLRRYSEPMREFAELMEEVGRVMDRWEQRALWFVLSQLGPYTLRHLAGLGEAEVEAAVLDALETVVVDGEFVPAVRAAVRLAPHLGRSQRRHLDHMLQHAADGDYLDASAPLYFGLEGAFWQAALARAVITPDRTRLDNPNKQVGFESMVKLLGLEREFQTFMVRAVFGTAGNPFRHGSAEEGERRQVLLGVAALAGWLEEFANVPAMEVLTARLGRELPIAVERARVPLLERETGTR
jgi:hypothetical protein